MRFGILGALRVEHDGVEVDLGRRQERLLLARLLVDVDRTVPVDRLLDDLWGDDPPPTATGSLQALVSRLRRVLEPDRRPGDAPRLLVRREPGYALLVAPEDLDACRFVTLTQGAGPDLDAGRHDEAIEAFDAALALWRGEVLADLADEPFVAPVAARYDALCADAREQRAAALLATGATGAAIADLELLVATDDLRQRPWELLLTALHAAGRTVEALDRYRGLRERLADGLGLDPGPGLQAIEGALLRGTPPAGVPSRPTLPSPTSPSPTSPSPATSPPAASPGEGRPSPPVPPDVPGRGRDDGLLGRAREQAALRRTLTSALTGDTSWSVLTGEAGIGKTRLAEDLAKDAASLGVRTVVGRCHQADLTPAFWPWVQVLRAIEDLAPGAASILEDVAGHGGDSAAQLFDRFDRLGRTLTESSRQLPLLVVLEDVHWTDAESLRLVDFLAVQLRDARIAFVLTSRRDEGSPELERTLGELARLPGHLRLDLGGLDTEATAALLASVTHHDVDEETAAALRRRTGGNPFFVTELARLGERAIHGDAVPDTVRDVLARRLARLSERAADLLTLAAVHGGEFNLHALVASSQQDEATVLDLLDDAMIARLVGPTEDPLRLRFSHALVREAALVGLSDLRRRRLHLRIAESLRTLAPEEPTAWRAEVAHHLLAAAPLGDGRAAVDAARAAAELAHARLAFHEAARWWEGAVRVLEWDRALGTDLRLRHDLLVSWGRSLGDAGDRPHAIQRLAEAIDVAESLGDARAMADAAIAFERTGGFWFWSEYGDRPSDLLDRLDRVLAALGDDDPVRRLKVVLVTVAGEYYGDQARGRALAAEALASARRLDDPELTAGGLVATIRSHWNHRLLPVQEEHSRELVDLAMAHRLPELELLGRTYQMSCQLVRGELDTAERSYRQALALSERLGLVIYQAQLSWTAAQFARPRGDHGTLRRLLAEGRELHARTRLYSLGVITAWNELLLAWEADRLDDLGEVRKAEIVAEFPEAEVLLRARAGDRDGARRVLAAVCGQRPLKPLFDALGFAAVRARLAADLEADELADDLIRALEPYATYLGTFGTCAVCWPVAIDLGRLQSLVGDHPTAVATLTAATRRAEAAGWTAWAARAREALEAARRRAGRPTDEPVPATASSPAGPRPLT
jgi:DNA-binding SARP family transcriptional activator